MNRKPKHRAGVSHERWLVSYADFITLLFAFFVVLYSSSQMDRLKAGRLAAAIQVAFQELGIFQESPGRVKPETNVAVVQGLKQYAAFNHLSPAPEPGAVAAGGNGEVRQLMERLQRELAPEIAKQEVRLRAGPEGIVLSLQELGFYDPGSDELRPGAEDFLRRLAPILLTYASRLRIEGHTDNVPIHNARFPSNWELSTARATGLVRLFVDQYDIPASRLSAAGYAEFHPVATNDTAEGRRLNRRIDLVILASEPPVPAVAGPSNATTALENSNRTPLSSPTPGLVPRVLSSPR